MTCAMRAVSVVLEAGGKHAQAASADSQQPMLKAIISPSSGAEEGAERGSYRALS